MPQRLLRTIQLIYISCYKQDKIDHVIPLNDKGEQSFTYYYYRDEVTMNSSAPLYYYRLKLIDNNGGHVYSNTITVTHIISGVRSTWGSIKAIFR